MCLDGDYMVVIYQGETVDLLISASDDRGESLRDAEVSVTFFSRDKEMGVFAACVNKGAVC